MIHSRRINLTIMVNLMRFLFIRTMLS